MTNYAALWTRQDSVKLITTNCLEKYSSFLKWNDSKEYILHDGCVDGNLTNTILFPFVKERAEKIVGIDRWQDLIDLAKQENKNEHIDYQLFDVIKSINLDNMVNKFDHIFSFCVAEWILPNRLLLEKYYQMLKPGGQIFMVILTDSPYHQRFSRCIKSEEWSAYLPNEAALEDYTDNPVEYFQKLLDDAGFETDLLEFGKTNFPFENMVDMLKLIGAMYYNHSDRIPAELKEDFLETPAQNCCGDCIYLGEPNKYDFWAERIICLATKN